MVYLETTAVKTRWKRNNYNTAIVYLFMVHLLLVFQFSPRTDSMGEQGWRSGDRARLPPIWPGFDSRTRYHKWVEFVVGSSPCSEGFSLGSPVFLPPQKSTFLNSNSIGNSRATGLSVVWLHVICNPRKNKVDLFIYLLFMQLHVIMRDQNLKITVLWTRIKNNFPLEYQG